jgi:hypothetical protein
MAQKLDKLGLGQGLLGKLGLPDPIGDTADFANSEDKRLKAERNKLTAANKSAVDSENAKNSSTKSKSLLG